MTDPIRQIADALDAAASQDAVSRARDQLRADALADIDARLEATDRLLDQLLRRRQAMYDHLAALPKHRAANA